MADSPRVMIVEDDQDMIDLLTLVLERGGFEPISALGGREALRKLQETPVDLVLLDLMMDDLSGWLVLQAVKANEQLSRVPVLIVSAIHYMEDPVQTEAHADMFEGYLVKPFRASDLLALVRQTLA